MHIPYLATALALTSLVVATPIETRQAAQLDPAIRTRGRNYVGTSLTIRNDATEQSIIKSTEFGSITPENSMKWDATEPNRGAFTFTAADAIANFATTNKKQLRCHTLVWYSQLPAWVSQINNNATLISVMQNHITTLMTRYKGKCTHWDVVNEALNEDGTYRDSVFHKVIGESYIPMAFKMAAAADPSAKLFYNDYNLEYGTAKHAGAIKLVKLIQSWGVKIDGVGFQAHLASEATPSAGPLPSLAVLTKSLQDVADLGVDVAYTELDIRCNTPATSAKLAVAATAWARVAQSCLDVKRCVGITVWGVSDKYSWIPGVFPGEGSALLWDDNFMKKPAYTSFLNVLNGQSVTSK
ncbi:glycosyl hydrolase family 10 [Pyrenophora seminiperda CCB06]|uniref:Beta-xylanase n=1 Tax=Pyrenophora seminiperda CCB06 TaxID=1302712 RepID=A0A3M7ME97_9PLEO|nr:glycosyl hydrolase family 10 [Pyrenophora seminiperda CCB06]